MNYILPTYFVFYLTLDVRSALVNFTVSPGYGKQKNMEFSFTQRSWFDALDICKQRGFESLIWSSKNLETFKTVRKAIITKRGTSNIDVWTSFVHFNYTWMTQSEWRNGHTCSLMNGYTITSAEPHPQQCSHAHLSDAGVQVSLHESKCSDVKYFVCYKYADTPLDMSLHQDTQFNYNTTSLRVNHESPNTLNSCMELCLIKRYCVAAVFHDNNTCVTVWYFVERELVLTATTGVTGYTLGLKYGDVVSFASSAISPIGNITELPCSPVDPNIPVSNTPTSAEQTTASTQVYTTNVPFFSDLSTVSGSQTTFFTTEILQTSYSSSSYVPTTVSSQNVTCTCACTLNVSNTYSFDDLKVNKKRLSSYTRRKTSAYDGRLSSKVIGVSGAIIIVAVISVIVSLDLLNIVQAIKTISMA